MADLTYKFKKPAVVPDEDEITIDDLLKKSSKSKSKPTPETDVNPQNYIPITDTSEEADPDEALIDKLTPTLIDLGEGFVDRTEELDSESEEGKKYALDLKYSRNQAYKESQEIKKAIPEELFKEVAEDGGLFSSDVQNVNKNWDDDGEGNFELSEEGKKTLSTKLDIPIDDKEFKKKVNEIQSKYNEYQKKLKQADVDGVTIGITKEKDGVAKVKEKIEASKQNEEKKKVLLDSIPEGVEYDETTGELKRNKVLSEEEKAMVLGIERQLINYKEARQRMEADMDPEELEISNKINKSEESKKTFSNLEKEYSVLSKELKPFDSLSNEEKIELGLVTKNLVGGTNAYTSEAKKAQKEYAQLLANQERKSREAFIEKNKDKFAKLSATFGIPADELLSVIEKSNSGQLIKKYEDAAEAEYAKYMKEKGFVARSFMGSGYKGRIKGEGKVDLSDGYKAVVENVLGDTDGKSEVEVKKSSDEAHAALMKKDTVIQYIKKKAIEKAIPEINAYRDHLIDTMGHPTTAEQADRMNKMVSDKFSNVVYGALGQNQKFMDRATEIGMAITEVNRQRGWNIGRQDSIFHNLIDTIRGGEDDWIPFNDTLATFAEGAGAAVVGIGVSIGDHAKASWHGNQVRATKGRINRMENDLESGLIKADDKVKWNPKTKTYEISNQLGAWTIGERLKAYKTDVNHHQKEIIEQINDASQSEEYLSLFRQADFTDGISFTDLGLTLGNAAPHIAMAAGGTALAAVSGGTAVAALAPFLTYAGSAMMGLQMYGDNYMGAIEQNMKNNGWDKETLRLQNPNMSEEEIHEIWKREAIKNLESGEGANMFHSAAFATVQVGLEKFGAKQMVDASFAAYKGANVLKPLLMGNIFKTQWDEVGKWMLRGAIHNSKSSVVEFGTEYAQEVLSQVSVAAQGDVAWNTYIDSHTNLQSGIGGALVGFVLPFSTGTYKHGRNALRNASAEIAKAYRPGSGIAKRALKLDQWWKKAESVLDKKYSNRETNKQQQEDYNDEISQINNIRNANLKINGQKHLNNMGEKDFGSLLDTYIKIENLNKDITKARGKGDKPLEDFLKEKLAPLVNSATKKIVTEQIKQKLFPNSSKTIEDQVATLKREGKVIFGDKLSFEVLDNNTAIQKALAKANKDLDESDPNYKTFEQAKQDSKSQGFIVQDSKTGKQTIYINKSVASKENAVNVAGHEFLHALLWSATKSNPATQIALGESLSSYLNQIDTGQIKDSKYKRRIEQYQKLHKAGKYSEGNAAEEVLTLFSDALAMGDIKFNEGVFTKIGDFIRRVLQSAGVRVKFNNGKDVYNFIKDYNRGVAKGRLGKGIRGVAKGVEGNLIKSETRSEAVKQEINKSSLAEGLSAQVQDLYDKKGKDAAFEITELYRGMANKIAGKYRDVPGYTTYKDDFIEQLLVDGRGVYGLVTSYNPKSGVPLAAYINKYLPSRAIEIANSIFQKEFTSDITEQRGVVAEETAVEEVVDDTPSLRKQLNIEENNPLYNKIKNAVIKAFGTKLPVVLSSKFKQALKKAYRTSLKPAIADLIGTRAIKEKFLSDNFEAIYAKLSQETINKRFQQFAEPLLDLNGNQVRENTREGKTVFKKRNITKAEWLAYFIGKNVKPSKRGSRKDALAESLAEELAFDATMEVIKDPAIQNKRKGIDEILEREQAENYIEEAGKQIDRNPSTKFSLSEEGLDFSFNAKERKSLTKLINQIQKKPGDIDKILEEYSPFKDQKPESIQQVQDTARWLHDSGLITNKDSHGFIQVIRKLGFKYGKALNAKLTHLDDLKDFSTDMKTLSSALGGDIMQIHSGMKDMLGYINRVLDPASKKETEASIKARKEAKDASEPSPPKIYKKDAFGAFYLDSLKVVEPEDKKLAKSLPAGLKLEFVEFMNSKTGIMKKIRDIQAMAISRDDKIALFKKVDPKTKLSIEQRVELANIQNVLLAKHIISTVTNLYKENKISESSMLHFFQLQTNAVNGLRALSKLDLIRFSTGKQFGMKTVPEHSEKGQYNTKKEAKDAYIASWKGVNGWNQVYAKIKKGLLSRTPPSKIIKLTIKALSEKGEHLAPNSNTMAGAVEIANNKDLNAKQRADAIEILLKNHVQWLDTNNNLDYVDVIGKTSALNAERIRVLSTNARKEIYVVGKGSVDIETYIDDSIKNNKFYDSQKTEATSKETDTNSKASLSSKSVDDAMAAETKERKRDPLSKEFNDMVQDTQGIGTDVDVSIGDAKQNKKGWMNWRTIFPASADDFMGMMYDFIGKGKKGAKHKKWIEDTLLNPYRKAVQDLNTAKQTTLDWLGDMKKRHKKTIKKLKGLTDNGIHTYEQAVRIYLYNKAGHDMTQYGVTEAEIADAILSVREDANLQTYADELVSKGKNPYENKPSNYWNIGNIGGDFAELFEGEGRSEYLKDFIANSEIVFSEANLNKIEKTRGVRYREALENMLHRMKTGRNRAVGADRLTNLWNDWINHSVGAIMFFNIRSAVLQNLSMLNFMNWSDNNPLMAAKAFANQKQYWSDFAMIFNSDKLRQRRGRLQTDVNANELTAASKKDGVNGALSYLLTLGFWPTQIADSFAISMGGASMYRNRINTYLKQGMSKADAETKAWQDFSDVSEESQQSSDPSLISQQQTGGMGRILLAFQNTPMQYFRLMQKAARDLKNGRGDRKTNISKIAYYGVVQNAMFVFAQKALWTSMFDDDDDERCAQFKDTPEDLKLLKKISVDEYTALSGEQKKARRAAKTRSKKNAKKFDKCSIANEESVDTLKNNMLSNVTKGAGIYGDIVMTAKNAIIQLLKEEKNMDTRARNDKSLLNLLSISPVLGSKVWKINQWLNGRKYGNDVGQNYSLLIEALLNLPVNRLVKKFNNMNDAVDPNNDVETLNRVLLALGWSSWNLKLDLVDTRNAEKKERKAEEVAAEVIQRREKLKNLGSSRTAEQDEEFIESLKKTNSQWQKDELYNYGLTEDEVKALKIEEYRIDKLIEFYDKKAPYNMFKAKAIKNKERSKKEARLAAQKKRIKDLGYKTEKEYKEHQDLKKETSTAEQKKILSSFGLTKAQIRYYKREDDRVKKIIALRKKKKK